MAEVKYYFRKLFVVFFANFVQFSRTRNALHFYETDIAAGRRKMTEKGEKKKETLNNSNLFEKKRDIKYPYYLYGTRKFNVIKENYSNYTCTRACVCTVANRILENWQRCFKQEIHKTTTGTDV